MVRGIEHTAIFSHDREALADWYVRTLGFVVAYRGATAFLLKATDGTMFEIARADGDRPETTMGTPGLRHVALAVDDFDADVAALRAHGVTFVTEPEDKKGNKVVFFADPDGNLLHFIQRGTPL